MDLDFEVVKRQIGSIYKTGNGFEWSLSQYVAFFRFYFDAYRKHFGVDHPRMRKATIATVMRLLPRVDGDKVEMDDYYRGLVEQYFDTSFNGCNHGIAHFVSGEVRAYRALELM